MKKQKIIVGISGASGAPIALKLLEKLSKKPCVEIHLIITPSAHKTIRYETALDISSFYSLADYYYEPEDIGAAIASGTFHTAAMIIVPCSMKTLAGISHGYSDNLLLRAADVILKEHRKLILVVRETPLHSIHLNNMLMLSNMGAIILPPVLSYYHNYTTTEQQTLHIVEKIFSLLNIEDEEMLEWNPKHL